MTTTADLNDALKYHIDVDHLGTRRYRNSADLLHRDEGPAVVFASGAQEWYQNGDLHCTTGPAIIWANGVEWWQNGQRHRDNGPAVVWHDGYKEWWVNDRLHRIDGPALTRDDGTPEWWIYGVQYTEQAYRAQLKTLGIAHDF